MVYLIRDKDEVLIKRIILLRVINHHIFLKILTQRGKKMINSIYKRISTRTYKNEILSDDEIKEIMKVVNTHQNIKGPFGNNFNFTFNLNSSNQPQGQKIGTYGIIKNVPAFVGGVSKNTMESIIDFGFVFENLLLSLTAKGFDTCWLGGTFKRKEYREQLLDNEIIPAISPIGHRAKKRSLIEATMRKLAGAQNRISKDILFKQYQNELPVDMMNKSSINTCLELVQLGPSASNKQPWRLYVDNNVIHFYIERTNKYPSVSLGYDIQALDIGIALCHFSIGLQRFEKTFIYQKFGNMKTFSNQDYIISIQINP
ncbi:nitroreductase family protein [Mycoplasmatota bacterium WC30]